MNLPLTNKKGQRLSRKFTGVFPPKTTIDKNALKAYLRGERHFTYGIDTLGRKQYFQTPQEYFYV